MKYVFELPWQQLPSESVVTWRHAGQVETHMYTHCANDWLYFLDQYGMGPKVNWELNNKEKYYYSLVSIQQHPTNKPRCYVQLPFYHLHTILTPSFSISLYVDVQEQGWDILQKEDYHQLESDVDYASLHGDPVWILDSDLAKL